MQRPLAGNVVVGVHRKLLVEEQRKNSMFT